MADSLFTGHTKYGTAGGIITIIFVNLNSGDVLKTIILTSIGAIVSFSISLFMKYCLKKWHR